MIPDSFRTLDPTRPCWTSRQTYKGSLILATVPSTPMPAPQSDFQQSFCQPLGAREIPMLCSSLFMWPDTRCWCGECVRLSLPAKKKTKCSPQLSKHVSPKTGTWGEEMETQSYLKPSVTFFLRSVRNRRMGCLPLFPVSSLEGQIKFHDQILQAFRKSSP